MIAKQKKGKLAEVVILYSEVGTALKVGRIIQETDSISIFDSYLETKKFRSPLPTKDHDHHKYLATLSKRPTGVAWGTAIILVSLGIEDLLATSALQLTYTTCSISLMNDSDPTRDWKKNYVKRSKLKWKYSTRDLKQASVSKTCSSDLAPLSLS